MVGVTASDVWGPECRLVAKLGDWRLAASPRPPRPIGVAPLSGKLVPVDRLSLEVDQVPLASVNKNKILKVLKGQGPLPDLSTVASVAFAIYLCSPGRTAGSMTDEEVRQHVQHQEWLARLSELRRLYRGAEEAGNAVRGLAPTRIHDVSTHFVRRIYEWGQVASDACERSAPRSSAQTQDLEVGPLITPRVEGAVCIATVDPLPATYRGVFDSKTRNRLSWALETKYLRPDGYGIVPQCEYLATGVRMHTTFFRQDGEPPSGFFAVEATQDGAVSVYFRLIREVHSSRLRLWRGSADITLSWGIVGAANLALRAHEIIGDERGATAALALPSRFEVPLPEPSFEDGGHATDPNLAEDDYGTVAVGNLDTTANSSLGPLAEVLKSIGAHTRAE